MIDQNKKEQLALTIGAVHDDTKYLKTLSKKDLAILWCSTQS